MERQEQLRTPYEIPQVTVRAPAKARQMRVKPSVGFLTLTHTIRRGAMSAG